jgi:predicted HTH transcriptional regulator
MDNFDEYLRQGEPNKAEKAKVWKNREIHLLAETVNDPANTPNDLVNDLVKRNILHCLKQNPKAIYTELAANTGYSAATIKRHIQELKKLGLIERIGSDKTGYWKVLEK